MIVTQTAAIFRDAFRELRSRRLFWLAIILSGIVVLAFAALGINARGLTIFHWQLDFGPNTSLVSKEVFYRQLLFNAFGVKFWLAWIATILAIVSTASIVPDMISSGSIELVLSRPIGRLRLFLTRYAAGLLFVAIQVGVFCVASFVVIGWRAGAWDVRLFLALPIVVVFFSYLFSICALLGMLTKSATASMLLTLLAWFIIFILTTAQNGVLIGERFQEERIAALDADIARLESEIEQMQADGDGPGQRLATRRERRESAVKTERLLARIGGVISGVRAGLPKVAETKELLERSLLSDAEFQAMLDRQIEKSGSITVNADDDDVDVNSTRVQAGVAMELRRKPLWWVLGTSLAFEAVVLALAGWIFVRRDF